MKTTPWILCCILFAVILYLQICKSKQATVPKSVYNAMVEATQDTVKYYEQILLADSAAIELAVVHAEQSADRARQSEDKLTESQGIIVRLNAKIDAAKKENPDNTFVQVSPHFIDGCDSLQLASRSQDKKINQYVKDIASLIASKRKEIAARDKALADRINFTHSLQKQLDSCQLNIKDKEQVAVKNQWFAEVGLMGNKVNPIGGGEAGITLINKRGVMYGVKGQLMDGQVWYGVKTGVRLFK